MLCHLLLPTPAFFSAIQKYLLEAGNALNTMLATIPFSKSIHFGWVFTLR